MKLSCLPVTYFPELISGKRPVSDWIREARDVGFDGFDLSINFFRRSPEATVYECQKAVENYGIGPAILNTYSELVHPSADRRRKESVQLQGDIKTAASVGAEYVRIISGPGYPEVGIEEGIPYVIEGFMRALEIAVKHDIKLVYENHSKPASWQYSDFSADPEIFLRIAEALKEGGIYLLFDTANCLVAGWDAEPVLQTVVNRVKCVHAADTQVRGSLVPSVIGEGIVPFESLLGILKSAGFDGWISLEEASCTGQEGVISGYTTIRDIWEGCLKI